jgi:hypothetical protein
MQISTQSADRVEVQLRGNAWLMDAVNANRLVAHIDLSGAAQGVESIRVSPGDFELPPGIVVDRVTPPAITLSLARAAGVQ